MRRKQRLDTRMADHAETRQRNRPRKMKERTRRDARMLDRLGKAEPPYTPDMMSWLSAKLVKKASKIEPDDIKTLLAQTN